MQFEPYLVFIHIYLPYYDRAASPARIAPNDAHDLPHAQAAAALNAAAAWRPNAPPRPWVWGRSMPPCWCSRSGTMRRRVRRMGSCSSLLPHGPLEAPAWRPQPPAHQHLHHLPHAYQHLHQQHASLLFVSI